MEKERVKIISQHNGPVSVIVPELRFSREWMSKGATIPVERETLEELMYDPGFKYMIDTGMLYIEDMQVKKDLGIEPEDAEEPVNIIILTDKEKERMMTVLPLIEFKIKLKTLNYEQLQDLADFAIRHELSDFQKAEEIKKACGKDIINAIRLNREDKED
jgi:uncharacterized protein Smg (DUF494 family)